MHRIFSSASTGFTRRFTGFLCAAIAIVFVVVSWLTFEYVLEE